MNWMKDCLKARPVESDFKPEMGDIFQIIEIRNKHNIRGEPTGQEFVLMRCHFPINKESWAATRRDVDE